MTIENRVAIRHGSQIFGSSRSVSSLLCGMQRMSKLTLGDRSVACLLFFLLLAIYRLDRSFLPIADAWVNLCLAESVLADGDLLLGPGEAPDMLRWSLRGPRGLQPVKISYVDGEVARLMAEGQLTIERPGYLLVPTVFPGLYADTFGPGAGLTAVPLLAVLHAVWGSQATQPAVLWQAGKWVASLCVAGSAVCVYLTARRFLSSALALLVAAAYALGTCVWTVSSQALWQHGPNELFLAAGTYCLCRSRQQIRWAAPCAAAYALATWCRPTSAVVVACVALYYLLCDRRALAWYLLAGLPFGGAMLAYNLSVFGSVSSFGELMQEELAIEKTGSPEIWPTAPWKGLAALLLSPSRGLFVFSPFLLFALWGAKVAWRESAFAALRPLALAVGAIWVVHACYFDWWGGWSYGYRLIVDTTTLLAVLLVPVMAEIVRRRALAMVFATLLGWSIFVQLIGAFAYEPAGWNNRPALMVDLPQGGGTRVTFDASQASEWLRQPGARLREERLNIDLPQNRHRMWSLRDNQIAYYATHFFEQRRERQRVASYLLHSPQQRSSETWESLGNGWLAHGDLAAAEEGYRRALEIDPWSTTLHHHVGFVRLMRGRLHDAVVEFDRALSLELGENSLSYWPTRAHWVDTVSRNLQRPVPELTKADAIVTTLWQGRQLLRQGSLEAAAVEFDKLVQRDPTLALGHVYLGMVHARQHRPQNAVAEISTGFKLGFCSADAEDSWGLALMELGRAEEARDHFANAVRLDSSDRVAARHLRSAERVLRAASTDRRSAS